MRSRLRFAWQPSLRLPILTVIAYLIWLIAAPPSLLRSIVGLLGSLAARLAAAYGLLTAARRLHRAPTETAWRTFGVGATLWAVGAGVAVGIRLASAGRLPLPSLADWIAIAGSLAALTGIASYRQRMPERFSRVREFLDIAILALAVAALAWLVFIRAALAVGLGGPIQVLWAAMPPAMELVLVGLLVRLSLRSEDKNETTVFGLLAFAALILTASDLGDGYRRLLGDASTGTLIEAGWMAAGLLMVFAAQKLQTERAAEWDPRPALLRVGHRLEALLPIAFTYAVVGTVILDWWLSKRVDWFMVAAAAALSLLLMARQGVIIGQVEMRQYAALVNSSADLSFICDKDGKILLANPALNRAVGWTEAAVAAFRLSEVLVADES
ncbi:MAG: PAS domain S-box protein, partial [Chloroflexota bacterium]